MPSPLSSMRHSLRQRGRKRSPGSASDGDSDEEAPAISEYAQTLEPSSTGTSSAAATRAVRIIAAPAPAFSSLPPAAQLPAPQSTWNVETPSTPATPDDGKDLDALLSEVVEQSDGALRAASL